MVSRGGLTIRQRRVTNPQQVNKLPYRFAAKAVSRAAAR